MKQKIFAIFFLGFFFLFSSCDKDKDVLNALNDYNLEKESSGYHFGDPIQIPTSVKEHAESISISFGDKQTDALVVSPEFFTLGDNAVTFLIKKKDGEVLHQDAVINVYAQNPEASGSYQVIATYPQNVNNFVQGFQLEGNTIYQSNGGQGTSNIMKYTLGNSQPILVVPQAPDIFSEGLTIVGDKIYQLTWRNKKGFVYQKKDLSLIEEFPYPNVMGEGWGLTHDGRHLIASDGTKNLYFLNQEKPSQLERYIAVAGGSQAYDQLNELEYHQGFIYANVWQKPVVLKINPKNGEVVAKYDFSELAQKHTTGMDDVLNGITFKDGNMLVTGKNWDKIYEVEIKD